MVRSYGEEEKPATEIEKEDPIKKEGNQESSGLNSSEKSVAKSKVNNNVKCC